MKKLLFIVVAIVTVLSFSGLSFADENYAGIAQAYSQAYKAWIGIEPHDSILKIKAFCQSPEDVQVRYKLVAKKIGMAGKTKTSQSGLVNLHVKEEKCLSQLKLRVSPEDEYEIRLEVYRDGILVAEDAVIYPPSP